MQCRDRRFRETTTKSGLGPTFKVTSSVVLWTSTRELRNFRGCHPCKLKCRLGILGFERRQQSTGKSASGDDNIVGSWIDLSSYYYCCASDFDDTP
ncbi:hypothetical protein V1477_013512 [Vespula maculifrons]|uniref:Uncharacterized protein n=1 Tax=Vespula maculifrons TaxID=7453 RepID=A0ABD2BQD3_VESMC